ncbi:MAG TPA: AMP-binding protein [Eoetvoesiella sp.]|uniref:AMP-binding protein n=1 Tax=Eoetvoesiella sp. TaxID=1966355 RepID=UPI002C5B1634|nr:AMP-binding protein [Eoetvoesiella sp.]HWK63141.1 AMP-binding protein [Eoetvoesiella sp.]
MNDRYPDLYSSYQWFVPSQFNIAQVCVHRWAENLHEGRRTAIYFEDENNQPGIWSYTRLSETSHQLANGLTKMGVQPGDRVAIVMTPRPELIAACMAAFSVGAIAVPLSAQRLGSDGLGARLRDAEARVALVDAASGPDLLQAQVRCPALTQIVGLGFQHDSILPWHSLLARQPTSFRMLPTRSDSAALLFHTGQPPAKPAGILHAHRALIGNLPGFVASQNWFPQPTDIFWTPDDATHCGSLLNGILPALYFGRAVVITAGSATGARALDILKRYRVTNAAFSPSTLTRLMDELQDTPREQYPQALRAIVISGGSLPGHAFEWCQRALGVTPNEAYGLAEANYVVGNSHFKWPALAGSLGRPFPGHLVTVLDDNGKPAPANIVGEIAINRYDILGHPDPSMFLGYWRNEAATLARFRGDWLMTGDLATIDKQGNFWHCGRRDQPLKSPGQHFDPAAIILARDELRMAAADKR